MQKLLHGFSACTGYNPRALASGLSPLQADTPWHVLYFAQYEYFVLKFARSSKGGIKIDKRTELGFCIFNCCDVLMTFGSLKLMSQS